MADLTAAEKTRLRRRIGDPSAVAFTDDELQAAYDEAGTLNGATVVLLEWLLADAVKLHDYGAAQTRVSKSQIPAQVRELLDYWSGKKAAANQVKLVGLLEVPPRDKEEPDA